MSRKKTIEMDGVTLTISPLTLEQVDQLVASREEVVKVETDRKEIQKIMFRTVLCPGLNNALSQDASDAERWTVERIISELDLPLAIRLQKEILLFSGLSSDEEASGKVKSIQQSGEVVAA